MAEQQLVDYIKKAKLAGQSDEQTKTLLIQNGWTDQEISEAFSAAGQHDSQPAKPAEATARFRPAAAESRVNSRPEYQVSGHPSINARPEFQKPAQESQKPIKSEPMLSPSLGMDNVSDMKNKPKSRKASGLLLKVVVVVVLLGVIGAGLYVVLMQGDLLQATFDKVYSYFSPALEAQPDSETSAENQNADAVDTTPQITPIALTTRELLTVPAEYDSSKIALTAFTQTGDRAVYCASLITNPSQMSCFLNGQKFLDNSYVFKPYWVGISPNGQRIIFLYYNSAERKSFVFENGVEGKRYDGKITSPKFSKDSASLLYVVLGNDGKDFVVLNEQVFPAHDNILTIPDWGFDNTYIFYGARDGNKILWVIDEIQPPEISLPGGQP